MSEIDKWLHFQPL